MHRAIVLVCLLWATGRAVNRPAGYRVTLIELQPYPFSGRPIDPDEYRATVRVAEQER